MSEEKDMDPGLDRAIRYVEGDMDVAERDAYEQALRVDPSVQADVEAARRTLAGLRVLGEQRLRDELKDAENAISSRAASNKTRMWWAAAAFVTLVGGAALWFVTGDTPSRLADEFSVTDPGLPVLMSSEASTMDGIMNAYKQGHDSEARALLVAALSEKPGNDTLTYYLGLVNARMGRCDLALEDLAEIGASSSFYTKGEYHRAICALRTGQISQAEVLLNAVAQSSDSQLAPKARHLLERMAKL